MPSPCEPSPRGPDVQFSRLRTDRLTLRRFAPQDAVSFATYRSDPEVARFQGWDTPYRLEAAHAFVELMMRSHPDTPGEWFQIAVEEASSGTHIGDVAALVDAHDPRLATIGFTLAPAAQGRGYATEAVTRLLDYLFTERGKHRVTADCDARNIASVAVLRRVGMRQEAHHRQSAWWKGEWTDELVHAVLDGEWAARQTSA